MSEPRPPSPAPPDLALHDAPRAAWRPGRGFGVVWAWTLRERLRPGRLLPYLIAVLGLAAGAGYLVRKEGSLPWEDASHALWGVLDEHLLQVLVPLLALLLVGPAYTGEVRQRTMVYLLVRPVSRTMVLLGRFLGGVVPAAALAAVLLLASAAFSGVALPWEAWGALPLTGAAAVLTLGAVYTMLAALFRRGLVAALVYTFLVEVVVAGLPGSIQRLSVRFHVRGLYHGLLDGPFARQSERVRSAVESRNASSLNPFVEEIPFESTGTSLLVLAIVAAVALLVTILHVRRRDFALKD